MKITIKNNPVTIRIEGGGGTPTPQPPVTAYSNPVPCIFYSMHGAASSEFEEEDDT